MKRYWLAEQDLCTSAEEVAHYGGQPVEVLILPPDAVVTEGRVLSYYNDGAKLEAACWNYEDVKHLIGQPVTVIVMPTTGSVGR